MGEIRYEGRLRVTFPGSRATAGALRDACAAAIEAGAPDSAEIIRGSDFGDYIVDFRWPVQTSDLAFAVQRVAAPPCRDESLAEGKPNE